MSRLDGLQKVADTERAENSRQVSTIVRTLGTTVIAVAWLFSGSTVIGDSKTLPTLHALEHNPSLRWCVFAALIALAADVLQYVASTALWATYRWAIDQVDINDNFDPTDTDTIHFGVKVGWGLLRLVRTARRLEYELDLAGSGDWKSRRTALRTELARSDVEIAAPPPAWMNGLGTLLFTVKIIALAIAWIALVSYLAST